MTTKIIFIFTLISFITLSVSFSTPHSRSWDNLLIAPPKTVTATKGREDNINVNWSKVNKAKSYLVYRSLSTNKDTSNIIGNKNGYPLPKMSDLGEQLQAGVHYYYWIRAKDREGQLSDWSVRDYGFIKVFVFNTIPTLIHPINIKKGQTIVDFAWTSVAGATSYDIQVTDKNIDTWTKDKGYSRINNLILDTTVTTNQFSFDFMDTSSENFAWTVRANKEDEHSTFAHYQEFFIGSTDIVSNNTLSDIRIISVELDKNTIKRGDYFSAKTSIENQDNFNIQDIQLSFFLSRNSQMDEKNIKLGQFELDELTANTSFDITPVKWIPQNISTGIYNLIIMVEENGIKSEWRSIPIRVN